MDMNSGHRTEKGEVTRIGDLPVRTERMSDVKGGGTLSSMVSEVMKNFGGALATMARS